MTDINSLAKLRRSYAERTLDEKDVPTNPFELFSLWVQEAVNAAIVEPNAMILSTASSSGKPNARVVLLKDVTEESLVFFTNYESRKAKELLKNPQASLLFYWSELGRQIRISGLVEKTSTKESGEYFKTRPYESRIAAWASKQSESIPDRKYLEDKFLEYQNLYPDDDVPLPSFWGGYRLIPDYFEFWQGRENRMHDRVAYAKEEGNWKIDRLSP
jgi:pyridoxamine 5'-phosphate oxidase